MTNRAMLSEKQRSGLRDWIQANHAEIKTWYDRLPAKVDLRFAPVAQAAGTAATQLGFPISASDFVREWDVVNDNDSAD